MTSTALTVKGLWDTRPFQAILTEITSGELTEKLAAGKDATVEVPAYRVREFIEEFLPSLTGRQVDARPFRCVLSKYAPNTAVFLQKKEDENNAALLLSKAMPEMEMECSWFAEDGGYRHGKIRNGCILNEISGNIYAE